MTSTEQETALDEGHLAAALAVDRLGSFTAAAKALAQSQSTVSRHVAHLERSLGVALFDRGATGIVRTEAGERLLPRLVRLRQSILDLRETAARSQPSCRAPS